MSTEQLNSYHRIFLKISLFDLRHLFLCFFFFFIILLLLPYIRFKPMDLARSIKWFILNKSSPKQRISKSGPVHGMQNESLSWVFFLVIAKCRHMLSNNYFIRFLSAMGRGQAKCSVNHPLQMLLIPIECDWELLSFARSLSSFCSVVSHHNILVFVVRDLFVERKKRAPII